MSLEPNTSPAPGWVGGFEESNPAFAYPSPDLSSLPVLGNLENIDKLQRQQKVLWPEFSWETRPGHPESRCFQMFAPDISRLGYTNEGRVFSIICPQQGACSPSVGCFNVEVTVTGQRGWANESTKKMAADMSVEGTIWFSPSSHQNAYVKRLWKLFNKFNFNFPSSKKHAIKIYTHLPGDESQALFPLRSGVTKDFELPEFALHPEAWDVSNLSVQIGNPKPTGSHFVDEFIEMVMRLFNFASGNMLKAGNILTWNVFFTAPELVDQKEWAEHAERWRESIDADHGSPDGEGTSARYFDGTPFKALSLRRTKGLIEDDMVDPLERMANEEVEMIEGFLSKHL